MATKKKTAKRKTSKKIASRAKPKTESEPRRCFVIMPLSSPNSDIRRASTGLLETVIRPVIEADLNLKVVAPHEMDSPGSITNQVVKHLLECDLVVGNLTGLNPNVMYELAIRHATRKPIVILAENGTALPFDISDQRSVFYTNDLAGAEEVKKTLRDYALSSLDDSHPDNPIVNVLKKPILDPESVITEDFASTLIDDMASMRKSIHLLTERQRKPPYEFRIGRSAPESTNDFRNKSEHIRSAAMLNEMIENDMLTEKIYSKYLAMKDVKSKLPED